MTTPVTQSALIFSGDRGLACPFSTLTAKELMEYILGYYESLHPPFMAVVYQEGKEDFLYRILKDGYGLEPTSSWDQVEQLILATEDLQPTPKQQLDHESFMEQAAWRLITLTFSQTL